MAISCCQVGLRTFPLVCGQTHRPLPSLRTADLLPHPCPPCDLKINSWHPSVDNDSSQGPQGLCKFSWASQEGGLLWALVSVWEHSLGLAGNSVHRHCCLGPQWIQRREENMLADPDQCPRLRTWGLGRTGLSNSQRAPSLTPTPSCQRTCHFCQQ